MKKTNFWTWFIPVFLILCIGVLLLLIKVRDKNIEKKEEKTPAVEVKELFEKYNNENYVNVNLTENNSYTIKTEDEIKNLIEHDTGVLLLGSPTSNITRSIIEILDKAIMSTSVKEIIYYDTTSISDSFKEYLNSKLTENYEESTLIFFNHNDIIYTYTNKKETLTEEDKKELQNIYLEGFRLITEECDSSC